MGITGWKTKTGAVLVALAGIIAATSGVIPGELAVYGEWINFVEVLLAAAGAAFMGVGIAHKVEKADPKSCTECGKDV